MKTMRNYMFLITTVQTFLLLNLTPITAFTQTHRQTSSSIFNTVSPKPSMSLEAVTIDEDNKIVVKDSYYSEVPNKNIPWTDLPKSYYQRKVDSNKMQLFEVLSTIEDFLGRSAMVLAIVLIAVETRTGQSVPEQINSIINSIQR